MKSTTSAALAWGGVLLAGALWGLGALVAQHLMGSGMTPQSLALVRFALGLPLLWWWHWRQPVVPRWRALPVRQRMLVAGTGAAMAFNVGCWFAGIERIGPALPTVISVCCAPAIVALVSLLRGYERPSARLLLALALALGGVLLVALPAGGTALPPGHVAGLAWSLGSAFCYALMVLGNARMPVAIPAVSASAWGMAVSTLCVLVVALPQGWQGPSRSVDWWGVAYTGVVTTSLAYLCFAWGARRLSPTAAVIGSLVEPLVAAVLAAWWLAEPMAPRQWWGALLLGTAMGLLSWPRKSG